MNRSHFLQKPRASENDTTTEPVTLWSGGGWKATCSFLCCLAARWPRSMLLSRKTCSRGAFHQRYIDATIQAFDDLLKPEGVVTQERDSVTLLMVTWYPLLMLFTRLATWKPAKTKETMNSWDILSTSPWSCDLRCFPFSPPLNLCRRWPNQELSGNHGMENLRWPRPLLHILSSCQRVMHTYTDRYVLL